jgi:hypothetical protein
LHKVTEAYQQLFAAAHIRNALVKKANEEYDKLARELNYQIVEYQARAKLPEHTHAWWDKTGVTLLNDISQISPTSVHITYEQLDSL